MRKAVLPSRTHKPPPAGSDFDAPYPKTPKTHVGEVDCRSQGGAPRKAPVWATTKGIDLDGQVLEPDAARNYARLVMKAADECDRIRAAETLEGKRSA